MRKFKIKLGKLHEESGLTAYAVAKQTGLNENNVRNYVSSDFVVKEYVHTSVIVLAEFYGVDWHDVVEMIEGDDSTPETETPLLATA